MATNTPDSFFAKQGSTQEEAQHTQPDPVYLSEDSGPEEEPTFTSGAPGFSSLSYFISSAYQNPAFELRQQEIESMNTPIIPEEDRKLSPSSASSNHESESDFEPETELDKKPKPKIVKLVSKSLRVKRNIEHGVHNEKKKAKKQVLWEYTDQKLSHDLVVHVLPTPQQTFVLRSKMTMKQVPKDVPNSTIDNTLLTALNKFGIPLCTTMKLSDVQTEHAGFIMLRRVVVRKRLSAGSYSYAVMPNMVISSKKKVYHRTQDGTWYEKTSTNNRSKEMAIPKPFQGNQSVDVLFDNTFSWDV